MPFFYTYTYKKTLYLILLIYPFFLNATTTPDDDGLVITVIDEFGDPMVAVAIYNAERGFATTTNEFGEANIHSLRYDDSITLTYLGYYPLNIAFSDLLMQFGRIEMQQQPIDLIEIRVKGHSRIEEHLSNIPTQVDVIDSKEIALVNPQTTADALLNTGNVFIQKSQMGGGSPVIRGFEANKVLIVVDGVRMNNAIYRNGHLQNAITVDNNMLESIEVVYGPAAVIYGSDALGGVMSFTSKRPRLALKTDEDELFEGSAFVRFASANKERTGHFDFNFGGRQWSSLTSFTVSNFDDLRTGSLNHSEYIDYGRRFFYVDRINGQDSVVRNNDPLVQVGTGYSQVDFMQKVLFQPRNDLNFLANIQYSNSSDVPRYDQLSESTVSIVDGMRQEDFRFAEWYYGPQKRFLSSLTMEYKPEDKRTFDVLSVVLAYQNIEEDRISRRFGRDARSHQEEDVHVGSLNVDFAKDFGKAKKLNGLGSYKNKRLLYGLEVNYNRVNSLAYNEHVETGEIDFDAVTRYPDGGSDMTMAATYIGYRQKFRGKYTVNAGLRYTFASLQSTFVDTTNIQLPYSEISSDLGALTGSLSLIWEMSKNTTVNIIASTAFRSPNVDDFGKIRAKGEFVTVPNPNLSSEYALNGEMGLTQYFNTGTTNKRSSLSVTGFYTYLFDAIVRDFTTLNGVDSLLHYGDYYTTQWNTNAGTAYIYGLSANLNLALGTYWNLKSSINYIKGWNTFDKSPLAHIPPVYGQTSLSYVRERFQFRFLARYNGWKNAEDFDLAGTDNLELATVDGSPSWYTLNAYATYNLDKNIFFTVAFENIMDVHYRPFSSGVSAPGRNLILSLRTNF
ncbi:MAG: TonB-dependent receptor [Saprospiraceae bacterium]